MKEKENRDIQILIIMSYTLLCNREIKSYVR